jgi:hypothetical protein
MYDTTRVVAILSLTELAVHQSLTELSDNNNNNNNNNNRGGGIEQVGASGNISDSYFEGAMLKPK